MSLDLETASIDQLALAYWMSSKTDLGSSGWLRIHRKMTKRFGSILTWQAIEKHKETARIMGYLSPG